MQSQATSGWTGALRSLILKDVPKWRVAPDQQQRGITSLMVVELRPGVSMLWLGSTTPVEPPWARTIVQPHRARHRLGATILALAGQSLIHVVTLDAPTPRQGLTTQAMGGQPGSVLGRV